MLDLGWGEILVIGIVALIVVGPKELPMLFRKVGQFVGRLQALAGDFRRAMDRAADESGVNEVKREMSELSKNETYGLKNHDPLGLNQAGEKFREANRKLNPKTAARDFAKDSLGLGDAPKPADNGAQSAPATPDNSPSKTTTSPDNKADTE